jgi:hypothetical protein
VINKEAFTITLTYVIQSNRLKQYLLARTFRELTSNT